MTESPHLLLWTTAPTGDNHLVTDANGEVVYCGQHTEAPTPVPTL